MTCGDGFYSKKGRQYPFDVCSKGFCTLPVQDKSTRCPLTNFDMLFHTMSYQIARYEEGGFKSDPGVYICSSDIIFLLPHSGKNRKKKLKYILIFIGFSFFLRKNTH